MAPSATPFQFFPRPHRFFLDFILISPSHRPVSFLTCSGNYCPVQLLTLSVFFCTSQIRFLHVDVRPPHTTPGPDCPMTLGNLPWGFPRTGPFSPKGSPGVFFPFFRRGSQVRSLAPAQGRDPAHFQGGCVLASHGTVCLRYPLTSVSPCFLPDRAQTYRNSRFCLLPYF